MDTLGKRCIEDTERIRQLRSDATQLEKLAREKREEAGEIERVLDLVRMQR